MNKVQLLGNAASELFETVSKNGKPCLIFRCATDNRGDNPADFHTISVWQEATIAYLKENYFVGMPLMIEGKLSYQVKKDENGKTYAKEAFVNAVNIINLAKRGGAKPKAQVVHTPAEAQREEAQVAMPI